MSSFYKIEVKITPLIEMLELPNFGQLITSTIWFNSRDKFFWWRHGQKWWCHNLYLVNLQTSSKLQPFLLKQTLKTQKKLKELEIMYKNTISTWISWYNKNCWLLVMCWYQQNSRSVSRDTLFGASWGKVLLCQVSSL